MIEYANLYLAAISALSSLIQAAIAIKATKKNALFNTESTKAIARAAVPYKKGGKNISAVIDDSLLCELSANIQSNVDRLALVLSDDTVSWADKESSLMKAKIEICLSLSVIKNLNQGRLPTKLLSNLWESHRCITPTLEHLE